MSSFFLQFFQGVSLRISRICRLGNYGRHSCGKCVLNIFPKSVGRHRCNLEHRHPDTHRHKSFRPRYIHPYQHQNVHQEQRRNIRFRPQIIRACCPFTATTSHLAPSIDTSSRQISALIHYLLPQIRFPRRTSSLGTTVPLRFTFSPSSESSAADRTQNSLAEKHRLRFLRLSLDFQTSHGLPTTQISVSSPVFSRMRRAVSRPSISGILHPIRIT